MFGPQARAREGEFKYVVLPREEEDELKMAVVERSVIPQVQNCLDKLKSLEYTESIVNLRTSAEEMVSQLNNQQTTDEKEQRRKLLNQLLHKPTCDIRQGKYVDIDDILERIRVTFEERGFVPCC